MSRRRRFRRRDVSFGDARERLGLPAPTSNGPPTDALLSRATGEPGGLAPATPAAQWAVPIG